jgi:hypothetical protein
LGYDLELLSFLKTQYKIYKEYAHFQKFIFIQKDKQKDMSSIRIIISIFYNDLQKILFKIHLYEKNIFEQKEIQSLFKVMLFTHCILFAPKNNFFFHICEKFHTN